MARGCRICFSGVAAVSIGVFALDRCQRICWVGHTDLEIQFVVTEAGTGEPVEAAEIAVFSEGGFYQEREEKQFILASNRDGTANRTCHNSMCVGTQSGLRFTDTYAVHLPWWYFQVSAPGYQATDWTDLDSQEYQRQVQRAGPMKAKLVVPVILEPNAN
jgi:hypothetical protein